MVRCIYPYRCWVDSFLANMRQGIGLEVVVRKYLKKIARQYKRHVKGSYEALSSDEKEMGHGRIF